MTKSNAILVTPPVTEPRRGSRISPAKVRLTRSTQRQAVTLAELRRSCGVSQDKLGQAMRFSQSRVSQFEVRKNVNIHSLKDYVSALGGELELVVRFSAGEVAISNFMAPIKPRRRATPRRPAVRSRTK